MKQERIEQLARETAEYLVKPIGDRVADVLEELITDALEEQRTLCIDCDEPSGRYQHRCEKCLADHLGPPPLVATGEPT
ncbi:hypothetical protein DRQ25_05225 [Candidatus Fermentibacteria bacterium]|nr:MAG: hypothetical protein DRQ25_05225 [Candidatus Fermentibacteria bacterium]